MYKVHEDLQEDDDVQDEDAQEGVENEDVQEEEDKQKEDDAEDGKPALHFIDCIVQGEQRADGNVVLSCMEAALHALKQRFTHVAKIIMQSENAKFLAGKQTKLLLPHVCSVAGLKLVSGLLPQ